MENQNDFQAYKVSEAKGLAKWFAVDVTIRLFGVVIWEYHFPPQKDYLK